MEQLLQPKFNLYVFIRKNSISLFLQDKTWLATIKHHSFMAFFRNVINFRLAKKHNFKELILVADKYDN